MITTDRIFEMGIDKLAAHIMKKLAGRKVFLSLDLDIVDPAFAPGVQIPEVGGLSAREILSLIRKLRGLNIVGADVVECNPMYDNAEITALLAATIGAEILALIAAYKVDNAKAAKGMKKAARK